MRNINEAAEGPGHTLNTTFFLAFGIPQYLIQVMQKLMKYLFLQLSMGFWKQAFKPMDNFKKKYLIW